jgi:endonuclease-3
MPKTNRTAKSSQRAQSKPKKKAATKKEAKPSQAQPRQGQKAKPAGKDTAKRVTAMIEVLNREHPDARCQLDFTTPFELLIATILSAQCTDVMVNRITPALFKSYPSPKAFVDAPQEDIEKAIFKTGFYRNKTKSIKKCCDALVNEHNGKVPATMEELVALGGVGRKTANCVLGNAYDVPGIVVDTHVKRLSNRIGLTTQSNPDKIEQDLMAIVPEQEWTHFSHLLGEHGRSVCEARNPRCNECSIANLCPKIL